MKDPIELLLQNGMQLLLFMMVFLYKKILKDFKPTPDHIPEAKQADQEKVDREKDQEMVQDLIQDLIQDQFLNLLPVVLLETAPEIDPEEDKEKKIIFWKQHRRARII